MHFVLCRSLHPTPSPFLFPFGWRLCSHNSELEADLVEFKRQMVEQERRQFRTLQTDYETLLAEVGSVCV